MRDVSRIYVVTQRAQRLFLALVVAQLAHSIEEYAFRLYEVFPPAQYLSRLISEDVARGFLIGNTALVLFGFLCYLTLVRPSTALAPACAWFWVCLEAANGTGHILIALGRGRYFPGVATAPFLLGSAVLLAGALRREAVGRRAV